MIERTADLWWKNAVIYCLDAESFADSNGDGCGDLPGLTDRIDYLAGIGVTCLWLMPFYPSPNRDDGYDIVDFHGRRRPPGDAGRPGGAGAHGARPRHPRDRRPGREPHLRPAPLVPGGARRRGLAVPRLLRLGRRATRRPGHAPAGLPRPGDQRLELRPQRPPVLPAPLLPPPARPERRQPRGARRDRQGHRLLAGAGAVGLSHRRRAVPDRDPRAEPDGRPRPARAAARDARLRCPARRRPRAAGRGQPAAARDARLLRLGRGRRAPDAVHVHGQPGDVPGVRARAGGADPRRPARAARDPRGLPVGPLRAQPRRADARQALRGRARRGVRRLRPRARVAAVRPWPAPASADDARQRHRSHPTCIQPAVLAAGNAGALLRRGDRHGREPRHPRPHERALADAVVGRRPERRLLGRRPDAAAPAGGRRPGVRAGRGQRGRPAPRPRLDAQLARARHPHAQGVPRDRPRRVGGARRRPPGAAGDPLRVEREDARRTPQRRRRGGRRARSTSAPTPTHCRRCSAGASMRPGRAVVWRSACRGTATAG